MVVGGKGRATSNQPRFPSAGSPFLVSFDNYFDSSLGHNYNLRAMDSTDSTLGGNCISLRIRLNEPFSTSRIS